MTSCSFTFYVDIVDQDIYKVKNVKLQEIKKEKKLHQFSCKKNTAKFEGFHWNNSLSANLLSMKRVLGKASRLDYSADKECYNLTKGDNSMSIKAKNTF